MATQGLEPIVVLDQTGQVVASNEAWGPEGGTLGFDYTAMEAGGNYLAACDRASGPDAVLARAVAIGIRDVLAGRSVESRFECSCPTPGAERAVFFRATPITIAGGTGAVVTYRPIDAAVHAEDRWRVNARSRALAQSTVQMGDWLIRPGVQPYFSEEMFRLHNLDSSSAGAADPAVETFLGQIHPDDRERVRAAGERFMQQQPGSVTCIYRTDPAAGPVRMLEATAKTPSGTAEGRGEWHGTVLDVTEREQQAAETRQRQKMDSVGRLAGGIAHDFNNILSEIIGFAGFVRDALDEKDARRVDILAVLNAADRAATLTHQLLEFSRQQPCNRRLIDLNQVMQRSALALRRAVGERVTLTVEPSPQEAIVLIDPDQFEHVLLSLATNAKDAMPNGGVLRMTVRVTSSSACVYVADTGEGMDDDTRRHLFKSPFGATPMRYNAGLGLATAFGIIEDAGGSIQVESSVKNGSTFQVTLPLAVAPRPQRAEEPAPAKRTSSAREELLLCEDEDGLRRVTARVLEQAGYQVHVARDGHEAIGLIDQLGTRLAAIITDVMMPCCTGDAVAAHAGSVVPGVPVMLTSGYFDESRGLSFRTEVLRKPVPPAELVRAVRTAIAKSGT